MSEVVLHYFLGLQSLFCLEFEREDARGLFREIGGARILSEGAVFDRVEVSVSHGRRRDPRAALERPDFRGGSEASTGLSVLARPRPPQLPSADMSVRLVVRGTPERQDDWWFEGGFRLTASRLLPEDVLHCERVARSACRPFGSDVYERLAPADRVAEPGTAGIRFESWRAGGFDRSLAFAKSVAEHFSPAYFVIVRRRIERDFFQPRERA